MAPGIRAITAAILAGGLGTRLRSSVMDRPKVLAPVAGRPFLAYLLEQLNSAGLDRVILCTGYRAEQVKDTFGDSHGRLQLVYSPESAPLGTGGCLRLAAPLIESDSVLVLNGDSYCSVDLLAFANNHLARSASASLVVTQVADTSRYGRIEVGPDGLVQRFAEKTETSAPGWINAGIYLLKRDLVREIPEGRLVSLEREMFPAWLNNREMVAFASPGPFIDIGTPESYAQAERFFSGNCP